MVYRRAVTVSLCSLWFLIPTIHTSFLFYTAVSALNLLMTGQGTWEDFSRPCENGQGREIDPKYHSTTSSIPLNDGLKAILERKNFTSAELANGRLLLDKAKDGIKSLKKGYALLPNHFDLQTGAVLQSGKNEEDAINAWLDEWYSQEQDDCNKEVIDIDAKPSAAPAASVPNLKDVDDFDGPLDEDHPFYYYTCGCGKVDEAACGVCGKGYASKQADAVRDGKAVVHESGAFHLHGKKKKATTAASDSAAADNAQAAKKSAAGGKSMYTFVSVLYVMVHQFAF